MHKCRKCICRSCMNTCGCRTCQENDGAVSFCDKYNQFEQLSFIDTIPKPVRQKLPRFITWDDYGITRKRYKELCSMCNRKEDTDVMRLAAYEANKDIAEYILLSVKENKSYEGVEYAQGLGRIPCGRTDFYGYRRLFYHILNEKLKQKKGDLND